MVRMEVFNRIVGVGGLVRKTPQDFLQASARFGPYGEAELGEESNPKAHGFMERMGGQSSPAAIAKGQAVRWCVGLVATDADHPTSGRLPAALAGAAVEAHEILVGKVETSTVLGGTVQLSQERPFHEAVGASFLRRAPPHKLTMILTLPAGLHPLAIDVPSTLFGDRPTITPELPDGSHTRPAWTCVPQEDQVIDFPASVVVPGATGDMF